MILLSLSQFFHFLLFFLFIFHVSFFSFSRPPQFHVLQLNQLKEVYQFKNKFVKFVDDSDLVNSYNILIRWRITSLI
jgi:hypothetical protein